MSYPSAQRNRLISGLRLSRARLGCFDAAYKSEVKFLLLVFLISSLVPAYRASTNFTSPWDEHSHLSYVQYVYDFELPAVGYPMNTWGREAFACHPHSLYGPMSVAGCGERGPGTSYPTGGSSTAAGWPPIAYFAIASLSRPFFLFFDDPLYAVRAGVVSLWALGFVALAFLARRIGSGKLQIIGASSALSALPGLGYFSSFVSPYSAIPLLTAYCLWVGFQLLQSPEKYLHFLPRFSPGRSLAIFSYPVVAVLTIPHSVTTVIALVGGIIMLGFTKGIYRTPRKLVFSTLSASVASATLVALAFLAHRGFMWLVAERTVPFPPDTLQDPPLPSVVHDSDWVGQLLFRAWNFFPNGINSALPVPRVGAFLASLLTWLVISVVVGRSAGLLESRDRGAFCLGVVVASPLGALLFYYTLTFEAPPRYGLPLAFLGFSLALFPPLVRRVTGILLLLGLLITGISLISDPIYIEQPCWKVGLSGFLEQCTPI